MRRFGVRDPIVLVRVSPWPDPWFSSVLVRVNPWLVLIRGSSRGFFDARRRRASIRWRRFVNRDNRVRVPDAGFDALVLVTRRGARGSGQRLPCVARRPPA